MQICEVIQPQHEDLQRGFEDEFKLSWLLLSSSIVSSQQVEKVQTTSEGVIMDSEARHSEETESVISCEDVLRSVGYV